MERLAPAFAQTVVAVASLEQLPPSLHGKAVLDRRRGQGPAAALEAGLAAARSDIVFAAACDMPSVTPKQARDLVAKLVEPGTSAAVPVTPRGPEPLAAAYRRDLAAPAVSALLDAGERRVGALLERLPRVVYVDMPELLNLNTPSDYEAFLDN
jgi:molybdopterin-guanine dinucleotide biosynthesis protein A